MIMPLGLHDAAVKRNTEDHYMQWEKSMEHVGKFIGTLPTDHYIGGDRSDQVAVNSGSTVIMKSWYSECV